MRHNISFFHLKNIPNITKINLTFKYGLFFSILLLISNASANLPDFSDIIKEKSPAVVKITVTADVNHQRNYNRRSFEELPYPFREFFERQLPERENTPKKIPKGIGSGFFVSSDGYILTNYHVIEGGDEITIRRIDRSEYKASIVGIDKHSDLALLKINDKNLPYIEFIADDEIKVGNWVVAIGSPFGLDYSASAGIISAIGRDIGNSSGSNYVPFIQTDVAINPGNSGGPLFNLEGKAVGVNSQIYTRSGGYMGLSFAIPASVAIDVIRQLKSKGKVHRGYLGVVIQDVDKELAQSFGLAKPSGALINQVIIDSPAHKSGIKAGDIIMALNNKKIEYSYDLPHQIGLISPNSKVKIKLIRKGKKQTISVTIGSLEGGKTFASGQNKSVKKLGIAIADIPAKILSQKRLRGGVEVINVIEDSSAYNIGLREGDVIVQLGFEDISSKDSLLEFLDTVSTGDIVPIRFYRQNRFYYYSIKIQ